MNATDDLLVLPHFETRLLSELRTLQRSGAWTASLTAPTGAEPESTDVDLMPVHPFVDDGPPGGSRRRMARRALVAAAAVAVVVGGIAVAQGGSDDKADVGTASESSESETPIEERIVAAIAEAVPGSVVHSTSSDGVESWVDASSHAERHSFVAKGGLLAIDRGRTVPPGPDDDGSAPTMPMRNVDYCLRQYSDTQAPSLWIGDAAGSLGGEVAQGYFATDGTETVDGRELLRLVQVANDDIEATLAEEQRLRPDLEFESPTYTRVAYVDPSTYLPVLIVDTSDGSTQTIEYLPRTPETLALLVPSVPEGFTQVASPALDDVRAATGCA